MSEIFKKVLTDADVKRKLSFPEDQIPALTKFGGCKAVVLLVKDDAGMLWKFACVIRSGVSPKPVIVSGWIQFVTTKGLQEGDVVLFYREDDIISGTRYKIEVIKKSSGNTLHFCQ